MLNVGLFVCDGPWAQAMKHKFTGYIAPRRPLFRQACPSLHYLYLYLLLSYVSYIFSLCEHPLWRQVTVRSPLAQDVAKAGSRSGVGTFVVDSAARAFWVLCVRWIETCEWFVGYIFLINNELFLCFIIRWQLLGLHFSQPQDNTKHMQANPLFCSLSN